MTLTHGELFAGIGGFGIGFDNAGAETKWHVEIDKHCQPILSRHWPDAQIESDVCEVGKHNLSPVDIISFGSPCQDLSIAGKRKGFQDGTRSNLFFEAVRIIQELNPRYAIWENVPGALSSHGGNDFKAVIESLLDTEVPMPRSGRWATAGMVRIGQKEIAWRVLDAQYFGVPQRRRRIFLIFCPRGDSASQVLFESEGVSGNTPPRREAGKEVAYSLRRNPSHSGDKGDGGINTTMVSVGALQARDYKGVGNQYANEGKLVFDAAQITSKQHGSLPSEILQPLNTLGQMSVFDRQRSDEYGEAATVSTVAARDYKSASDLIATSWDSQRARIHDPNGTAPTIQSGAKTSGNQIPAIWEMSHASESVRQNGDIAPTLQGRMGTGGNQVPLVGVRRLTPTECERLQGFPDGFTDGQVDTHRYKQLGNAVAVPVVEWIAKRIVALT